VTIRLTSPISNPSSIPPWARAADVVSWLRSYAAERIDSRRMDERRAIPPHIVLDFGNRGLFGVQVGDEYGGLGLGYRDAMRVTEQLAAIDLTLAMFVGGHNSLGVRPIVNHASPDVRDELLPRLATGRELAAFAITEPGAGSNPRALSAYASPDGQGGFRLRGTKIWSGSAGWGNVINVFVRQLGRDGGPRGISGFVVRHGTAGLRIGPEALTMGLRGMVQNTIYLEDARVSSRDLLGAEGAGMDVAYDTMSHARLGIAAACVGAMKRCAQLMHRYAARRQVSTGLLLDNPISLTHMSELAAAITCIELLVEAICELLDAEVAVPGPAMAACKVTGSEWLGFATDRLVQLLGGRGYMEPNLVPQLARDARLLRVFEGPTETLLSYIGSTVLHRDDALHRFIAVDLEAPTPALDLSMAAEQIRGIRGGANVEWVRSAIGHFALYTFLRAAAERAFRRTSSALHGRAAEWARRHEMRVLRQSLEGTPADHVVCNADTVTTMISSYRETIGDLWQSCAGEDVSPDALLLPLTELPMQRSVNEPGVHGHGEEAVLSWLVDWLGRATRVPAPAIDPRASLRILGVDSIQIPDLVSDLESWFGRPIPLDGFFQNESLEEFARHVATCNASVLPSAPAPLYEAEPVLDRFEQFPQVRALRERLAEFDGQGVAVPYFRVDEDGTASTARIDGRESISYTRYDYLGLMRHPAVVSAAKSAIDRYGTTASASRLTVQTRVHVELERAIADFIGAEDSLVFSGGHATNVTTIGHLFGPKDLILCDAFIHNSVSQGAKMAGAACHSFAHDDCQDAERALALARGRYERVLVAIEGVYSADGDVGDVPRFVDLRRRYQCFLLVDEAHSIGVLGPRGGGVREHFGLAPSDVDLWMGTLSKSLVSCGGYIAGQERMIEYLRYTAPGFIFSAGISPANAAAALAALRVLASEPERVLRLRERGAFFLEAARRRGLRPGTSRGIAVVPILIGETLLCLRLVEALLARGISVQPLIPPAVPEGAARLRFFVTASHTEEQILATVDAVADELAKRGASISR